MAVRGRKRSYVPHRPEIFEVRQRLEHLLDIARFYEKIGDPDADGCWPWKGSILHTGRRAGRHPSGCFRWGNKSCLAHRVAWEIYNRRAPGEAVVCHSCDNPICVNPDHLFLGTADINNKDKMLKGRARKKLNPNAVRAIRLDGRHQWDIAADFGIGQAMVSAIKRRAAWGWLPD
jgi:hypothetical protein